MYKELKAELEQARQDVILMAKDGLDVRQADDRLVLLRRKYVDLNLEMDAIDEAVEYLWDHLDSIKETHRVPGTTCMDAKAVDWAADVKSIIKGLRTKTTGGRCNTELDEINEKSYETWAQNWTQTEKEHPTLWNS